MNQIDEFGGLSASQEQKRMYFALMRKLGYKGDEAKELIKRKLGLDSFTHITTPQLTPIIDKLVEKVDGEKK